MLLIGCRDRVLCVSIVFIKVNNIILEKIC